MLSSNERNPAPTQHRLTLRDGTEIVYREWLSDQPTDQNVLLFHRGHEHSGRFEDAVACLKATHSDLQKCNFFAWDARGHGLSEGARGCADGVAHLASDADEFVQFLVNKHSLDLSRTIVVGHSIGAVIVTAWVHDYAPRLRALILLTPAFRVRLYVPLAIPGLRLLHRFSPGAMVKSYVRPEMLTHDRQHAETYRQDKLIASSVSVKLLLDMHDTSKKLIEDAGAIHLPICILTADRDWVVFNRDTQAFFAKLASTDRSSHRFPGMLHDLLHEADRKLVFATLARFIATRFQREPLPELGGDADKQGASYERWQDLWHPLPLLHPKRWYFTATRWIISTLGQLSDGIRLGWRTGFNSGEMLDYVYRNQANGKLGLGKIADRVFLDAPGWKGIRVRRKHLDQLLDQAIEEVWKLGEKVQLLDVAAGAGRYVLDAIQRHANTRIEATLCDRSTSALDSGKAIAAQLGIQGVTFRLQDAFDADALQAAHPKPNIAIISGLFELFPDNEPIRRCLRGLSLAMTAGSKLIITNQPWHPQLELIARVLHGYDRQPWRMRCRSTAEIDDLLREAGFHKQRMLIDSQGIFTVTLATKR